MTAVTHKAPNPIAHLSSEQVEQLGKELDALRKAVMISRGPRDEAYIRRMVATQQYLNWGSRALLLASVFPPAWVLGTLGLSVAKILDNMEIGHNVLHGQWNWMNDEKIHSSTYRWDSAAAPAQWKKAHNGTHHTYTNILGKDNDLGYGIMRVDEDQEWRPILLLQPFFNLLNACFFQYGIASYDMELRGNLFGPKSDRDPDFRENLKACLAQIRRNGLRDYVAHPLLALGTGSFLPTLLANGVANLARNVWSHSIIMCGHFPEGVETFALDSIPPKESRGAWYLRQMLGSANISGNKLFHILAGNLSHQIEHHMFPALPSNRYAELAPKVREIFARYDLRYHEAGFSKQLYSSWHKVVRLSLPNDFISEGRSKLLKKWQRRNEHRVRIVLPA